MLAASVAICLLMALTGALAPARFRPFIFGAMLPLTDFLAVPGGILVSGSLLGFICLIVLCYRAPPLNLLQQAATLTGVLLMALIVYDLFAIALAGSVFSGRFLAMPNDALARVELAQPVAIVKANLNQLLYLVVGSLMPPAIQAHFARRSAADAMESLDGIMTGLALSSSFFVIWQLASQHGVPYPADLIHIGSRANAFDQEIGGVKRIAGSYSEPSALGSTVGLALCYLLGRSPAAPGWRLRLLAISGAMLCLVISTSTSALIMLAFAVLIGGLSFLIRFTTAPAGAGSARSMRELAAISPIVGLAFGGAVFLFSIPQTRNVLYAILLQKARSSSFAERQASNDMAARLFSQTFGFGVGLGGHVASSGFLTLAANLGVVGITIMGIFILRAVALPFRPIRLPNIAQALALQESYVAMSAFALGCAAVMLVSASPFGSPLFWCEVGFAGLMWRAPMASVQDMVVRGSPRRRSVALPYKNFGDQAQPNRSR